MIIEVGKSYLTRDGRRAVMTGVAGPFYGGVEGVQYNKLGWNTNGCYADYEHPLDLISPWTEDADAWPAPIAMPWIALRSTQEPSRSDLTGDALVEHLLKEHCIPTQIKSESKMDVKVGDRVLIEGVVGDTDHTAIRIDFSDVKSCVWVNPESIKSVEPAPPGVGDTVAWGSGHFTILGFGDGWSVINREVDDEKFLHDPLSEMVKRPGFRVLKRAEPK